MKLKRKITTDSVMEELKKKFNRPDLTNEGLLDWITGGSKKADSPAPNPDSGAETAKGPEPAAPEAPSTASGPTPNAGRGGFGRLSAAMVGPNDADKAAGEAKPENTPGAIAIEKPGDIAKVDTTTAKGIGGTDSKLSFDQKQDAAAKIDASDKAAGMTPKEPVAAKPEKDPYADWGGNSGEATPPAAAPAPALKPAPKPAAPKPAAAPKIDTAAIYAKHGVGGSNEDAGAFHRAEAEIKAMRSAAPAPKAAPGKKLRENFDQFAKKFVQEQAGEKYIKKQELKIVDPDHADPSSPNRGHVKNEEAMASPGLGARHNPKKTAFKTDLHKGSRNWGGNQKRTPSTYAEEATKIVKSKVMEKKKEAPLGSTSTGKKGEAIDLEPVKPELTGYH